MSINQNIGFTLAHYFENESRFIDMWAICLLGPLRTEKHLWRITSAAIAVAMVTGITRCT